MRRRYLLVLVIYWVSMVLVAIVIAARPLPVPDAYAFMSWSSGPCLDADEQQMIGLVNDYRVQNGLPTLYASAALSAAADYHSLDMATYLYLSHTLAGNDHVLGTADDYSWSQNITNFGYPTGGWRGEAAGARDYRSTAYDFFIAFTLSPEHNALLLDPSAKAIGPGYAQNDGDTFAQTFWVLDFGDRIDAPASNCGDPTPTPTNTPLPTATLAPTPTKTPKPCNGHGHSCH